MWMLLLIGFMVPLVYIGYLMSKLDNFLANGGFAKEEDEICTGAIVLGGTDLAKQITEILQKNTITVLPLAEPLLLEQKKKFHYLFALSENDVDNVVLCKIGKKVYGIEKMISVCNDPRNEGMFMSEKIRYLSGKNLTVQMVYQVVVGETEVKLWQSL